MSHKYYDIVIIGSGIAGLYSAYTIQKMSPETSFVVLEKYKKQWIGGRTNNETFYGAQIVTGAGIGRKKKDKLLVHLLKEIDVPFEEFSFKPYYSKTIKHIVNINKTIHYLKNEYDKYENKNDDNEKEKKHITFKEFAKHILGNEYYNEFLTCVGYTDYENEDAYEVISSYGMDDNSCCWKGMYVPWKKLVMTLYHKIGAQNVKTSMNVISVSKIRENPSRFLIETEGGTKFICNKVIVATTITSIRSLFPKKSIYNEIEGQNFLRLYGKFSKYSSHIMKQYVKGYTIVPGPLQKVIPMDADKGVYMIAYSDNKNASFLKNYITNTEKNRSTMCFLLEKALGIPRGSLELVALKDFYWPIGTHYYKPLSEKYTNREEFIDQAQHPEECVLVVGEVVSENQGWTNGALSSVKKVLHKKWVKTEC